MGLDNFKVDINTDNVVKESEIFKVPDNDYKVKTDLFISKALHKVDVFSIPKKEASKKTPMTIYFEPEYLDILKAIAYTKKRSVNEILMLTLKDLFDNTNFPNDFNIDKLSKKYDESDSKMGRKKKKK